MAPIRSAPRSGIRPSTGPTSSRPAQPVACYPKRWDSVSFYLDRDVDVFAAGQERAFVTSLGEDGRRLLFVKTQALPELLKSLPEGWEFVQRGEPGVHVMVGLLRKKN